MDRLKQSHDVAFTWHAFELRPKGSPPTPPDVRARIEAVRPQLYAMAREQYGIELNSGPFGIDSRMAHVGGKFAEAQGLGEPYHDAVFRAYWQQAQSIDDQQVLADLAVAVGLKREAFLDALQSRQYGEAVLADIGHARAYRLSGVPALIFDGKYLVMGAQPYEVLRQVVERVVEER